MNKVQKILNMFLQESVTGYTKEQMTILDQKGTAYVFKNVLLFVSDLVAESIKRNDGENGIYLPNIDSVNYMVCTTGAENKYITMFYDVYCDLDKSIQRTKELDNVFEKYAPIDFSKPDPKLAHEIQSLVYLTYKKEDEKSKQEFKKKLYKAWEMTQGGYRAYQVQGNFAYNDPETYVHRKIVDFFAVDLEWGHASATLDWGHVYSIRTGIGDKGVSEKDAKDILSKLNSAFPNKVPYKSLDKNPKIKAIFDAYQ